MIHFYAANITPFLPVFQTFSAGWQLMTQKGGICQAMCPRQDFPLPVTTRDRMLPDRLPVLYFRFPETFPCF